MTTRAQRWVVLVTGAAGKTGRAVTRRLVAAGFAVRGLARDAAQAATIESLGGHSALGDLEDGKSVRAAVDGASAIYHICPNVHPGEVEIGRRVIAAARAAEIERFVFHSVLHPQIEAMPHHWAKLRVEEALFESDLAFTILQPAPYMQNLLGQLDRIAATGVLAVPYATHARVALVDLEDVAAAAARVLESDQYLHGVHELCGPELLDQNEIAQVLADQLGLPVRARRITLEEWARNAACSPGSYPFETLAKMFAYYERHGLAGSPLQLECVLGRPSTTLAAVLERHADDDSTD